MLQDDERAYLESLTDRCTPDLGDSSHHVIYGPGCGHLAELHHDGTCFMPDCGCYYGKFYGWTR